MTGDLQVERTVAWPWRLAVPLAVYAGILGLSSIPQARFDPVPVPGWFSYLAHAIEYGSLGAALRWAMDRRRGAVAVTVLVGVLAGLGDEWWQSHVPGRTPSGLDLLVDLAAVTVAAIMMGRWLDRRG